MNWYIYICKLPKNVLPKCEPNLELTKRIIIIMIVIIKHLSKIRLSYSYQSKCGQVTASYQYSFTAKHQIRYRTYSEHLSNYLRQITSFGSQLIWHNFHTNRPAFDGCLRLGRTNTVDGTRTVIRFSIWQTIRWQLLRTWSEFSMHA